jgi:hypothetical protein
MLNEPALSLHQGLKDVVFGVLLTPVAPKLLRDRADDRLSVGRLPWCCYEWCSRDDLHHRLSPFLDQNGLPSLWRHRSFSVQFFLSLLCQRLRQRPETGTRAVTSAIVDLVRVFALNGGCQLLREAAAL